MQVDCHCVSYDAGVCWPYTDHTHAILSISWSADDQSEWLVISLFGVAGVAKYVDPILWKAAVHSGERISVLC